MLLGLVPIALLFLPSCDSNEEPSPGPLQISKGEEVTDGPVSVTLEAFVCGSARQDIAGGTANYMICRVQLSVDNPTARDYEIEADEQSVFLPDGTTEAGDGVLVEGGPEPPRHRPYEDPTEGTIPADDQVTVVVGFALKLGREVVGAEIHTVRGSPGLTIAKNQVEEGEPLRLD